MPTATHECDALIFGGGISGLWTLAYLQSAGYSCVLLESRALGAGRTIASQGIIHGGIKYALTGEAGAASRAIAAMPGIWRACLDGAPRDGHPDLRGATVLSDHQHLWTTPGLVSRIAGLGASKVIRTPVEKEPPERRPPALAGAPKGVDVYRVDEPVLDARSVVRALAEMHPARLAQADGADWVRLIAKPGGGGGGLEAVEVAGPDGRAIRLVGRHVVFAAGAGNAPLAEAVFGPGNPAQEQRRPLHMVMARGAPARLFGHCLGASSVPRLTVTTGALGAGGSQELIWYIGGGLAETGVERDEAGQIVAARDELARCLPWLDCSALRFATLRIDRIEGVPPHLRAGGTRPDEPVFVDIGNVTVGWPTKLAFAPAFAERVRATLEARGVRPSGGPGLPEGLLARPRVAPNVWDAEGLRWS